MPVVGIALSNFPLRDVLADFNFKPILYKFLILAITYHINCKSKWNSNKCNGLHNEKEIQRRYLGADRSPNHNREKNLS